MTDKDNLVTLAKSIAIKAHEGQVDKAGAPYWHHPAFVADQVATDEEKAVAWLHDVVEDTDVTFEDLLAQGIPSEVVEGVKAITKVAGESYDVYLNRVKANPLARAVKLADLRHNMDLSRIAQPTEKDFARIEKYKVAQVFLFDK
ncbi:MAG: guanosine-3',5'-bis(diphosphate) 3'-pyrophosphohydrolase [Burkholderiaceae bacterium]|nr:guanosine-3',5'-bis(diphosphate) 3'-pyrophosphohydrolase [Burkholderiaceae bacterium]